MCDYNLTELKQLAGVNEKTQRDIEKDFCVKNLNSLSEPNITKESQSSVNHTDIDKNIQTVTNALENKLGSFMHGVTIERLN